MGMPVNASEMALIGIGTNGVLKTDGGIGTWLCGLFLVSLARKVAATTGSDSVPKEKASLQAFPVAPQPARDAALAANGKELAGTVKAWTLQATLVTCES